MVALLKSRLKANKYEVIIAYKAESCLKKLETTPAKLFKSSAC